MAAEGRPSRWPAEGPPAGRDALVYSEPPWAAGTLQGPLGHFLSEFLSFPVFSLYVANSGSPFSSSLRFPFSEKPLWPPWMGYSEPQPLYLSFPGSHSLNHNGLFSHLWLPEAVCAANPPALSTELGTWSVLSKCSWNEPCVQAIGAKPSPPGCEGDQDPISRKSTALLASGAPGLGITGPGSPMGLRALG